MYNEDLEEDNSDYVEEAEGEEDESDVDDDDDEGTEKPAVEPQQPAEGLFLFYKEKINLFMVPLR